MKHPKYYCERCLKDKEPEELFAVGHKMLCAECERKAGPGLLALRKLDFANIRRGKDMPPEYTKTVNDNFWDLI